MDTVEFVGKSERAYTNAHGQERMARNVSIITDGGEVGSLFVSEQAYKSLNGAKRGDRIVVHGQVTVYRGEAQLRVSGFTMAAKV
jgi:hypothetical protein